MTIMELGAIGEFVGAIGVVVTLAYLAVQIRQNTRAMEGAERLALAQTYQMKSGCTPGNAGSSGGVGAYWPDLDETDQRRISRGCGLLGRAFGWGAWTLSPMADRSANALG